MIPAMKTARKHKVARRLCRKRMATTSRAVYDCISSFFAFKTNASDIRLPFSSQYRRGHVEARGWNELSNLRDPVLRHEEHVAGLKLEVLREIFFFDHFLHVDDLCLQPV